MVFDTADISNQLVKLLSESFDRIALVCSLVVFLFLCLSFRRLELSLISFLPLAVSWFWILGIMGLLDIRFNIVNIILATFIFGQGDDYTIFITEGLIYEYAYGKKRLSTYKNSIFLSALIMFIGIGALVLARHPAMKSLGTVTVIGMFIVVMMAYYLPPVIFRALTEKHGVKRDVPITLKRLLLSGFALTAFVLLMFLFVYPWTFFHFLGRDTEEKRLSYHRFLQKLAGWLCRHVPGVRTVIPDLGKISFEKPAVIICNHQSHLDQIFLMQLTPKLVFFTNDWVWNNPLYGYVIRKAEFYPASDGMDANLERIRDLTSRGYSVAIFPEGTRSADCRIGRFHKGAFLLAETLGVPIRTMFLHGQGYVLPKKDFMLREGEINVEVGERFMPEGDCHKVARSFTAMYRERYSQMRDRIETPEYCARYVSYKYIYKGTEIESAARKALRNLPDESFFAKVEGTKHIENCGQGEYALLYALVNRDVKVVATDPSPDNIAICRNISFLPDNIVFEEG
jgi:1-acyl-sn-glycerol-3-phosphate acyltransferase